MAFRLFLPIVLAIRDRTENLLHAPNILEKDKESGRFNLLGEISTIVSVPVESGLLPLLSMAKLEWITKGAGWGPTWILLTF